MTILVLIINPQNQYNLQIINVDFGYHNETIKQDSNMNIQNINKINHIEAKIKNIDNSEQKSLLTFYLIKNKMCSCHLGSVSDPALFPLA